MKKKLLITGMAGFIFFTILYAGCNNGAGGPMTIGIDGTWLRQSDNLELVIDGENWDVYDGIYNIAYGTFILADKLTLNITHPLLDNPVSVHNYSLNGNTLTISGGLYQEVNGVYNKASKGRFDGNWRNYSDSTKQLKITGSTWEYFEGFTERKYAGTFSYTASGLNLTITYPSTGKSDHGYGFLFSDNILTISGGTLTVFNGTYCKEPMTTPDKAPNKYDSIWRKQEDGYFYYQLALNGSTWEYYNNLDLMYGGTFIHEGERFYFTVTFSSYGYPEAGTVIHTDYIVTDNTLSITTDQWEPDMLNGTYNKTK